MKTQTSEEALRGAYEALLRGDYALRNRLCERARLLLDAEQQASAVERVLSIDFYITSRGVVIPTNVMAKAAGALQ